LVNRGDGRQDLVVDFDQLECIFALRARFGDGQCDEVADEADLVDTQWWRVHRRRAQVRVGA
jgi:hypothetical protein